VLPAAIEDVAGMTEIETSSGAVPVPLNATICGLEVPLSMIVRLPVREPIAAGSNVIEIAQLAPGASVAGLTGQSLVDA
jgi:hypothetical protein